MEKKNFKRRVLKRKRELPYRKWSDYETTLLVDYIKENEFEKPSGRMFYETFVQTFHMNIEWTLVKNKMRNLKKLYEKALTWQRSEAAQNIPDGETVQSIINRICPFFDSLSEVFSKRVNHGRLIPGPSKYNSTLEIEESGDTVFKSAYSPPSSPQPISEQAQQSLPIHENTTVCDNVMEGRTSITVNNHQTPMQPANKTDINGVENTYLIESKASQKHDTCNCLVEVVKMMFCYTKEKNEYQKARLELEHEKFDFEKEKTFRELELRQREIEKNERLQVLEIESKERITMKELEYKYKRF